MAFELAGLLIGLSCLPNWLIAKWYAAHGAKSALQRAVAINAVLAIIGTSLLLASIALEFKHAKPLLTYAFGLLGIAGLLVSAALHTFDRD